MHSFCSISAACSCRIDSSCKSSTMHKDIPSSDIFWECSRIAIGVTIVYILYISVCAFFWARVFRFFPSDITPDSSTRPSHYLFVHSVNTIMYTSVHSRKSNYLFHCHTFVLDCVMSNKLLFICVSCLKSLYNS